MSGLLISAAGAAMGGALVLRWGRCLGGYETEACSRIQDHIYDYMLPSDPWLSIPGTAQLAGVAYVLLAAGLAVGATRYVVTRAGRIVWATALGLHALVGLLTLWSGLTSATLAVNLPVGMLWFYLGTPLLVVAAVIVALAPVEDRAKGLCAITLAALASTHDLLEFLALTIVYPSYDTPPWTGSIRAVLLVALGLTIAVHAAPRVREESRT